MTLKIGFVTSGLGPQNGWTRYSRGLIEAVATQAEVQVVTAHDKDNVASVAFHDTLPGPRFHPLVQWKVCREVMRHCRGCDVVHCLIEMYAPGAALGALLIGAKFTMTLHGTYAVPRPLWTPIGLMLRFAYMRTKLVTTGSKQTEQKTREATRLLRECRFIPNGVDLTAFRQLHLPREPLMLTTGGIKARKGADLGARALVLLKDRFPSLRYSVVGDMADTAFVAEVRAIAEQGGVSDRLEFPGIVDDATLLSLYNRASVFVLAARDAKGQFEGFPMVYFEANACGTPVVTTRGFGSEYAIRDGINGFLTPPEDAAALAEAIAKTLDATTWKNLSEGALRVAKEHTWSAIATQQLIPFYRDVAAW